MQNQTYTQSTRRADFPIATAPRRQATDRAGHGLEHRGPEAAVRRRMRRQYRATFSHTEKRGEVMVRVFAHGAPGFRAWLRDQAGRQAA